MNWEIEVFRIVARARICVHGCDTAEQAKGAALKAVQQNMAKWEKVEAVVATTASHPFDQDVPAKGGRLIKPPPSWSPPTVQRKARNDGAG